MIFTIIVDPLYTFIIGTFFGLKLKPQHKPYLKTKHFLYAFITNTIFGVLIPIFCYILHADWMWMYFVDSKVVPWWLTTYIFFLYYIPFICGFLLAPELGKMAMFVFILAIIFELFLIALLFDRYYYVGTLHQFKMQEAIPLPQTPIGIILTCSLIIGIPFAVFLWLRLKN
jgi:hypothetical protein